MGPWIRCYLLQTRFWIKNRIIIPQILPEIFQNAALIARHNAELAQSVVDAGAVAQLVLCIQEPELSQSSHNRFFELNRPQSPNNLFVELKIGRNRHKMNLLSSKSVESLKINFLTPEFKITSK